MAGFFAAINSFLRTIVALAMVGLLSVAGWYGFRTYHANDLAIAERDQKIAKQDKQIRELNVDLEAKRREIKRLAMANRLLKVDRRVAHVEVVDQWRVDGDGELMTKIRFHEVDKNGDPLAEPREFTIRGDVLYVEAWLVKFRDELTEAGDPLRGTSLYLFRRLFSEKQAPEDGFELDSVDARPAAYRSGTETSALEQEIWRDFWSFANDQARRDEEGVRAVHGEAPSMKLRKDKQYKLVLRASDGLSIIAEDRPNSAGDSL